MRHGLVLVVAVALTLAACGLVPGTGGEIDGEWVLVSGSHDGQPIQLVDDARVTMTIDGEQVSGTAACNQYGGEIERDGATISIGMLAMTEMACDEPLMSIESAFVDALTTATAATRAGDRLTLTGPGVELAFAAVPAVPDADLVGTRWALESLITGDAVSSVLDQPFLVLAEDGSLSGSTGCRSFSGSYELDGATLLLGDFFMDMRACTGALGAQDGQVTEVLESQPTLSLDGRQLTVDAGGTGLLYRADEE